MIQFIPIMLIMIPVFSALLIYIVKAKRFALLALFAQAAMIALTVIYTIEYFSGFADTTFTIGGWNSLILSLIHI